MSRKTRRRQRTKTPPIIANKQKEPLENLSIGQEATQSTLGFRGLNTLRFLNGIYYSKTKRESMSFSDMIRIIPIVGRAMTDFQDKCSRAEWKLIPAIEDDEDPQSELAQEFADMVTDILLENPNFNWNDVVRRDAGYKYWGYSVSEWTMYLREDGVLSYIDISPRSPATINRFELDVESGHVLGFEQGPDRIFIPRWKTVYLVDNSVNDTPDGMGVLKRIQDHADDWLEYMTIRSFSIRQDLRGMLVGRVPLEELNRAITSGTLSKEEEIEVQRSIDHIDELLNNQDRTEHMNIILPSDKFETKDEAERPIMANKWDIESMRGEGKGLSDLRDAIKDLEMNMARAMYAEHVLLGETSVGSYSLAEEKSKSVYQLVDEALDTLAKAYDAYLITPLFVANGWPMEMKPTMGVESADFRTLDDDIKAVQLLNSFPPESPSIDHFAAKLGVPVLPLEDRMRIQQEQFEREDRQMEMRGRTATNNRGNNNGSN